MKTLFRTVLIGVLALLGGIIGGFINIIPQQWLPKNSAIEVFTIQDKTPENIFINDPTQSGNEPLLEEGFTQVPGSIAPFVGTAMPAIESQSQGSNDWWTITATIATVMQALDIIERRWRERLGKHQEKQSELLGIIIVMDNGDRQYFQQPGAMKKYLETFRNSSASIKPFQVVFVKRIGKPIRIDITEGGPDNAQLTDILDSLNVDQH